MKKKKTAGIRSNCSIGLNLEFLIDKIKEEV